MKRKRRRERTHKRRIQAVRGRRLVIAALTVSVLYWGLFVFLAAAGDRWESGYLSAQGVGAFIGGIAFILWGSLAVFAFLGHHVFRPLFLILNFLVASLGVLWNGFQLAQGRAMEWLLFDIAGVGTALFVCWVFFGARDGQAFFEEQEFHVKRT